MSNGGFPLVFASHPARVFLSPRSALRFYEKKGFEVRLITSPDFFARSCQVHVLSCGVKVEFFAFVDSDLWCFFWVKQLNPSKVNSQTSLFGFLLVC